MVQEWDIKPLSKTCTACQRPFEDGERYATRLVEVDGRYERGDFCLPCWERERTNGLGCSRWTGLFRRPPPPPDRKVHKETAETLLRRLMEERKPEQAELVYILAVMLERQRVLVEQRAEHLPGREPVLIYVHRRTSETFLIPYVAISEERLPVVQKEIMQLLVPAEATPSPAAPSAPTPTTGS